MTTSHRPISRCQNYDYFSRSRCPREGRWLVVRPFRLSGVPDSLASRGKAPACPAGALLIGSVRAAGRAGPDERVAIAVLVVEEVGVDGGVEARIVELEAQIVAALVGAFGPGGADLDAADQNPVAGGVFA